MNYNRKIMRLELSAEKALNGGYYYAELLLPAADYEIKDAMQRTRAVGRENTVEVSILECDILPELQDIRLDTFSLDELNFLAKRLVSLTDEEIPVFYAVTDEVFRAADNDGLVSIKDLINSTYGLDTVPIASGISGPEALGRFAIENGLLSDLEGIPESAVPFLNAEQIGRVQQKNDNGVFEGRLYIPTVHYDRPEIYDGETLPEEEPENAAFLLKVGAYPKSAFSDEDPALHDLCLPADSDELFNVTDKCGEPEINLCFCYEFYSSIPQITWASSLSSTDTALTVSTSFSPPPCVREPMTADIPRTTKNGQSVFLLWTRKTHGNTMSAVTPDSSIYSLPMQGGCGINSDCLTVATAKTAVRSTLPTG